MLETEVAFNNSPRYPISLIFSPHFLPFRNASLDFAMNTNDTKFSKFSNSNKNT